MNKFNTIQAGYRVTIISWENDGDAYDTNIIEGLSKERVEFIIELCKLFYSGSNNGGRTFGNMYELNAYKLNKACVAIQAVMSNHCAVLTDEEQHLLSLDIDGDDFSDSYLFTEMMADYLGRSEEDFAFRVFTTMKIERIPHEIQFEDVTGKFDV